jgi:hypothetical protein
MGRFSDGLRRGLAVDPEAVDSVEVYLFGRHADGPKLATLAEDKSCEFSTGIHIRSCRNVLHINPQITNSAAFTMHAPGAAAAATREQAPVPGGCKRDQTHTGNRCRSSVVYAPGCPVGAELDTAAGQAGTCGRRGSSCLRELAGRATKPWAALSGSAMNLPVVRASVLSGFAQPQRFSVGTCWWTYPLAG